MSAAEPGGAAARGDLVRVPPADAAALARPLRPWPRALAWALVALALVALSGRAHATSDVARLATSSAAWALVALLVALGLARARRQAARWRRRRPHLAAALVGAAPGRADVVAALALGFAGPGLWAALGHPVVARALDAVADASPWLFVARGAGGRGVDARALADAVGLVLGLCGLALVLRRGVVVATDEFLVRAGPLGLGARAEALAALGLDLDVLGVLSLKGPSSPAPHVPLPWVLPGTASERARVLAALSTGDPAGRVLAQTVERACAPASAHVESGDARRRLLRACAVAIGGTLLAAPWLIVLDACASAPAPAEAWARVASVVAGPAFVLALVACARRTDPFPSGVRLGAADGGALVVGANLTPWGEVARVGVGGGWLAVETTRGDRLASRVGRHDPAALRAALAARAPAALGEVLPPWLERRQLAWTAACGLGVLASVAAAAHAHGRVRVERVGPPWSDLELLVRPAPRDGRGTPARIVLLDRRSIRPGTTPAVSADGGWLDLGSRRVELPPWATLVFVGPDGARYAQPEDWGAARPASLRPHAAPVVNAYPGAPGSLLAALRTGALGATCVLHEVGPGGPAVAARVVDGRAALLAFAPSARALAPARVLGPGHVPDYDPCPVCPLARAFAGRALRVGPGGQVASTAAPEGARIGEALEGLEAGALSHADLSRALAPALFPELLTPGGAGR